MLAIVAAQGILEEYTKSTKFLNRYLVQLQKELVPN